MADEVVVPILPCRSLDDVLGFYTALGFETTYRQDRPYPCAGVRRGGIDLQFFALDTFEPEQSLGSVIIQVSDTGVFFDELAAGLRAAYGRLPVTGIPRITRPRRHQGTAAGFSVVDPGGNWLRISGRSQPEPSPSAGALGRVLKTASRQGDVRGDAARGIAVLEAGLVRHPDAPPADRAAVLAYLAELLVRTGDHHRARAVRDELRSLPLDDAIRAALADLDVTLTTEADPRREV
ncbi:VOC family protein [Desertihabitans aurantiacus]|uniref:hypothetical protein n=1 Tax=Desertihabitans aurantiacus TaxID=2282477 RepID=UPI000DF74FF2|nr:hypothetical protein [Desertihabitans aurantiacus]